MIELSYTGRACNVDEEFDTRWGNDRISFKVLTVEDAGKPDSFWEFRKCTVELTSIQVDYYEPLKVC